jgi:hypothetical protein
LIEQARREGGIPATCVTRGEDFDFRITLYSRGRDHIVSVADYPEVDDVEGLEAVLTQLFPWATVELDEIAYYDEDVQRHDEECGLRDAHVDQPWGYTEEFEEWRNDLPALRPHDYNDPGDEYSLVLSVNELGRAFLALDEFLRNAADEVVIKTRVTKR